MSDAITHARKQQDLWSKATTYVRMYFNLIPLQEGVTREYIEGWFSQYERTPESMKKELEGLNLL